MSRGLLIVRIAAVALLAAATAALLQKRVLLPLQCASAVSRAAASLADAADRGDHARRSAARRARATLRGCESTFPPVDARVLFTLGDAATALDEHHAAIREYERALALDRRPETYFALGMAQLNALDREAALRSLARACAFDPARLAHIPYDDVRRETERRVRQEWE